MSKVIEALRQAVEHRERISLDDIDAANLLAEIEHLRKDAARYQYIRAGGAYIEPNELGEIYMATETGKYYKNLRDMDMDIDEAMAMPESGDSSMCP